MKSAVRLLAVLALGLSTTAQPQEYNGPLPRREAQSASTDRLIVKWRTLANDAGANTRAQKLSLQTGVALQRKHALAERMDVLQLEREMGTAELQSLIRQVQTDPQVEYATPAWRRYLHAMPNDQLFAEQWYLQSIQPAAIRSDQAWDVSIGNPAIVVAVLDTGVRFEHPDLGRAEQGGKLLPGFDFISRSHVANDGGGWDADASDPGDWVNEVDKQQPQFSNCEITSSSWHGTRVSGMIAASTDNAIGVAGAAWNTQVVPIRVMGKCGGFDDDIIAGMRWAAGLPVSGVPANPTPAKIINLSLGGEGACSAAYQSTISELLANDVLVVVSVGNTGGPVTAPANCSGAFGVTGLRHVGTKVGFSNLGPTASLGAPGGNCVNTAPGAACLFSLVVATNSGFTAPAGSTYTNAINYNVGTSFSAPMVAAAAALMRSVNAQLGAQQLSALLKESANPFPVSADPAVPMCRVPQGAEDIQSSECSCTTQTCGAGMLNTGAAVLAAQRPYAVASAPGVIDTGTTTTLDARASFAANGRNVVGYQWSVANVVGAAPSIVDTTQAVTTLQVSGTSQFTLRLTVTDDLGAQDSEDISMSTPVTPMAPLSPPPGSLPPDGSSGGGGGGAMGWQLIGLMAALRIRRRSPSRTGRSQSPDFA